MNVNYIWQSNGNYEALFYMNTQQRSYFTTLVTQVKCTDGYNDDYLWAFIGDEIADSSVYNVWSNTVFRYDGNMKSLMNSYARNRFILLETGYNIKEVSDDTKESISNLDVVKSMPTYPKSGSIKEIDGIMVIKLEDI